MLLFTSFCPTQACTTPAPVDIRKKQKKTSSASEAATAKQRRGKRKGKGAAVDPRKRKSPEHTQQMIAVEEDTVDNDNAKLSRKMPPEPTQQMKETTLFALKEIDRTMFEEGNADNIELGDMGNSDDEGAEADIHNEGVSLREVLESSNEPIGDDADNIDDVKGVEFSTTKEGNGAVQMLGASDGWFPLVLHLLGLAINQREMPLHWRTLTTLVHGVCIHLVQSTRQELSMQDISLPPEQLFYLPMNMVTGS
jgi:hypothetical protein